VAPDREGRGTAERGSPGRAAVNGRPRVAAVVVAAGAGTRMGLGVPKAFIPLAGRPMIAWSLATLRASADVTRIIAVVPSGGEHEARAALGAAGAGVHMVPGGASRAESVLAGVRAAGDDVDLILVHDAARPLVTVDMVARVLAGIVDGVAGAIVAAPVADTLKAQGDTGAIARTVDRAGLWGAQTPQAFRADAFRAALDAAARDGRLDRATDCASLLEAVGAVVRLIAPGAPNLKVTTPDDRLVAEALLGPARGAPVD